MPFTRVSQRMLIDLVVGGGYHKGWQLYIVDGEEGQIVS